MILAFSLPLSMASITACNAVPLVDPNTPNRIGADDPLWAMSVRACFPSNEMRSTAL